LANSERGFVPFILGLVALSKRLFLPLVLCVLGDVESGPVLFSNSIVRLGELFSLVHRLRLTRRLWEHERLRVLLSVLSSLAKLVKQQPKLSVVLLGANYLDFFLQLSDALYLSFPVCATIR
jgi:hypothetical protein